MGESPSAKVGGLFFIKKIMLDLKPESHTERIHRIRDEAFLAQVPQPLWLSRRAPLVMPLSLARLHQLIGEASPLLQERGGRAIPRRALARALYILSPAFNPASRRAWQWHRLAHAWCVWRHHAAISRGLRRHIFDSQVDAPASPASRGKDSPVSTPSIRSHHWLANRVHWLASRYHWSLTEIMQLPVALVNLLYASDRMANAEPGQPTFDPAVDRDRGERLRKLRGQRLAQGKIHSRN